MFGLGRKRSPLVGRWRIDPTDEAAIAEFGMANLEFGKDGRLTYSVDEGGKQQIMLLTYEVEGQTLFTDQPSSPRQERTQFAIDGDTLQLEFGGVPARFKRA
jgi:hypothetical protein